MTSAFGTAFLGTRITTQNRRGGIGQLVPELCVDEPLAEILDIGWNV